MARIWSEEAKLERWLEVELAALDGWAEVGTIPPADVATIRNAAVLAARILDSSAGADTAAL